MFDKDISNVLNEGKQSDWVPPSFYGLGNSSRILPLKGEEKESESLYAPLEEKRDSPSLNANAVAEYSHYTPAGGADIDATADEKTVNYAGSEREGYETKFSADSKDDGLKFTNHEDDMFYKMFDEENERTVTPVAQRNLNDDIQDKVGDHFQYTAWNKDILVKNREIMESKMGLEESVNGIDENEGSDDDDDEEWDSEDDEEDDEDEDGTLGGMTMSAGLMRMLGMDVPDEEPAVRDHALPLVAVPKLSHRGEFI